MPQHMPVSFSPGTLAFEAVFAAAAHQAHHHRLRGEIITEEQMLPADTMPLLHLGGRRGRQQEPRCAKAIAELREPLSRVWAEPSADLSPSCARPPLPAARGHRKSTAVAAGAAGSSGARRAPTGPSVLGGGPSSSGVTTTAPLEEDGSSHGAASESPPLAAAPSASSGDHIGGHTRGRSTRAPSEDDALPHDAASTAGSTTPHPSGWATPAGASQSQGQPRRSVETASSRYDSARSDSNDGTESQSPTVSLPNPRTSLGLMVETTELLVAKYKLDAEVAALRDEVDLLNGIICQLERQRDGLRQEAETLVRERDAFAKKKRELQLRTSALAQKNGELEQEQVQLAEQVRALEEAKQRVAADYRRDSAEAAKVGERRLTVSRDLDTAETTLATRRREVSQVEGTLATTRSATEELKKTRTVLAAQVKTEREKSDADIASAHAQAAEAKRELAALHKKVSLAEKSYAYIQELSETRMTEVEAAKLVVQQERKGEEETRKRRDALVAEIGQLNIEFKKKSDDVVSMDKRVRSERDALHTTSDTLVAVRQELKTIQSQVRVEKEALERLQHCIANRKMSNASTSTHDLERAGPDRMRAAHRPLSGPTNDRRVRPQRELGLDSVQALRPADHKPDVTKEEVDGATDDPEIDRSGDADAQLLGDDQQGGGQALGTAEDQPDAAKNEEADGAPEGPKIDGSGTNTRLRGDDEQHAAKSRHLQSDANAQAKTNGTATQGPPVSSDVANKLHLEDPATAVAATSPTGGSALIPDAASLPRDPNDSTSSATALQSTTHPPSHAALAAHSAPETMDGDSQHASDESTVDCMESPVTSSSTLSGDEAVGDKGLLKSPEVPFAMFPSATDSPAFSTLESVRRPFINSVADQPNRGTSPNSTSTSMTTDSHPPKTAHGSGVPSQAHAATPSSPMRLTSPSTTSKAAVTWGVAHTLWSTGKAIGAAILGSDVESNAATVDKTGEDAHPDRPGAPASTLVTTPTTSKTSLPDPPPSPRTQDLAKTGLPMTLDTVGRSRDPIRALGDVAQTCSVHGPPLATTQAEAQEVADAATSQSPSSPSTTTILKDVVLEVRTGALTFKLAVFEVIRPTIFAFPPVGDEFSVDDEV